MPARFGLSVLVCCTKKTRDGERITSAPAESRTTTCSVCSPRKTSGSVTRGLAVFTDLDDSGEVIAKKGDDIVYGTDGINPLRPAEWISTLKASGRAAHLWRTSMGGGAPAHHGANGQQMDWSKLPPAERLTAFRQQQEAARNR